MEVKKTKKELKEVEVIVENYYTCDKCGVKIEDKYGDAFEFDFELKEGCSYPDGGGGEKQLLDLCKDCAWDAVNLLKENGFKVREEDWYF